jgi:hypothetical protein
MTHTRLRPRLAVEPLEARETPAGIVNVTFAHGLLTLVGDESANGIGIGREASGGPRLEISATDGNTIFRLNGAAPLAEVTLPAPVTGDMTIRMGDGNDSVVFRNVSVPGSLRIFGGDGDNAITVRDSLDVGKNLSVTNGSGYDQMSITGSVGGQSQGVLDAGGAVTIKNQTGGSAFVGEAGTRLRLGSLSLNSGEGFDRTDLLGEVKVTGNLSIRNGPGGSLLQGGVNTTISVGSAMSITSGVGIDTITLGDAYRIKASSISIRQGLDRSETTLAGATELSVDRNLAVGGGPGFDRVQVGGLSTPTTVGGNVQFNLGTGGSDIGLYGSTLTVKGSIGVRAGAGQDTVNMASGAAGPVGKGVAISLGSGENQTAYITGLSITGGLRVSTAGSVADGVSLLAVQVGQQTVIATGEGNDQVMVGYCTFGGPFLLSTGSGNDSIGIEANPISGFVSHFNGPVSVRTGAGDDSVTVGYVISWLGIAVWAEFADVSHWDGGAGTADQITILDVNRFNGPQPVITGFE